MISNSVSAQPIPSYFLQEASELLQQIDAELQTMRQDFSVQKMHALMRAAHTLKGAAASVGLDAIKTTTHSLEDAFKALCAPDATLTPAVEGLIFEAYECLQLLLSAQLAGGQIDESGILDRMAGVVAKLQENLGDQFGQDGYLPTSTELGFDMTQSIFEMGVAQRLDELEIALKTPNSDSLTSLLQSQAEVFFGLAESLNLPGFGEISQATLTALKHNPTQTTNIAQIALNDYRSGQADVLKGDRTKGGQPSVALKQLGQKSSSKQKKRHATKKNQSINNKKKAKKKNIDPLTIQPSWLSKIWQRLNQPIHQKAKQPQATDTAPQFDPLVLESHVIEDIAIVAKETESPVVEGSLEKHVLKNTENPKQGQSNSQDQATLTNQTGLAQPLLALSETSPNVPISPNAGSLRVSVDHLEQLNHTIGELLTQQNRQALYHDQLTAAMQSLMAYLEQQQKQLHSLKGQVNQPSDIAIIPHFNSTISPSVTHQFDALELDHYSDLQLLVQASMDTMVQQIEHAESVYLFARQSGQTLEKQQRIVATLRETMLEVRMQPLGTLFQRFHQVIARLAEQHEKPAMIQIQGSDVLGDKVIVEKLYDPLLHLVRNAFDHGIEMPEVRQQQGKVNKGQISLSACQEGRHLVIRIQDNGKGLDLEAIRQKACDSQLITAIEAQQLTPVQVSNLIFEPDFSTASQVDDLSGRGVGLNVVRSQIQTLQGSVTVAHKPGQGSCFTLKIPANLTIAKLLLCRTGEKLYALMTDTIEQILVPSTDQFNTHNGRKLLSLRIGEKQKLIPIMQLSAALKYNATLPQETRQERVRGLQPIASNPIILIRCQQRLVGLEVDQLLGEQELVIRSLGDMAATPNYIYGCSILPDGRLSLVLDGEALILKRNKFSNPQSPRQIPNIPNVPARTPSIEKQAILIVDDSITVRNTLTQTLQKAGYSVLQAKEGGEALQKLQKLDVQAILCDIEMPGMNGFEFLKARQQTPNLATVPTIMLTSRTGSKHRQLAQELGATGYLTKPYLPPQLLATLKDALIPQPKT